MADVLVAGGSGFIGSHLVEHLLGRGDQVTVSALEIPNKVRDSWQKKVEILPMDLRDPQTVKKSLASRRFEFVFNLSGFIDHTPFFKGGRAVMDQHFLAVQNIIEFLDRSKLKSFVQIGSSDEYGNAPAPQKEDFRESPITPYSVGKVASTHFIQMLNKTEEFPGVGVRFFLVYGPGQDDRRFIPQIIKGCLEKGHFPASEGKQVRDFCYVGDIVQGLIRASHTKAALGQVINLASGVPVTIRSVVEKIVKLCNGGIPQFGAIPYRSGENMFLYADIHKSEELLGWRPTINLDEGLKKTIQSFRELFSTTTK